MMTTPDNQLYVYTVTPYRKMINGLRARKVKGYLALGKKNPQKRAFRMLRSEDMLYS
ncbi:hypothetical protein [Enterobacter kobei]|uniref:hypothetical protein n=1 Tax=Enterobacter kobei TaxID=208224 RepID=UPI0013B0572F|nr:hypothetical protein [Enterobacter kobei]